MKVVEIAGREIIVPANIAPLVTHVTIEKSNRYGQAHAWAWNHIPMLGIDGSYYSQGGQFNRGWKLEAVFDVTETTIVKV